MHDPAWVLLAFLAWAALGYYVSGKLGSATKHWLLDVLYSLSGPVIGFFWILVVVVRSIKGMRH